MKPGDSFKRDSPANRAHVNSPLISSGHHTHVELLKAVFQLRVFTRTYTHVKV